MRYIWALLIMYIEQSKSFIGIILFAADSTCSHHWCWCRSICSYYHSLGHSKPWCYMETQRRPRTMGKVSQQTIQGIKHFFSLNYHWNQLLHVLSALISIMLLIFNLFFYRSFTPQILIIRSWNAQLPITERVLKKANKPTAYLS